MTISPSLRGKNGALLIAGILMIATTLRRYWRRFVRITG